MRIREEPPGHRHGQPRSKGDGGGGEDGVDPSSMAARGVSSFKYELRELGVEENGDGDGG